MVKEFEIKDILNAMETISKIDKRKVKISAKKDSGDKDSILNVNNRADFNESGILVLEQMIE